MKYEVMRVFWRDNGFPPELEDDWEPFGVVKTSQGAWLFLRRTLREMDKTGDELLEEAEERLKASLVKERE